MTLKSTGSSLSRSSMTTGQVSKCGASISPPGKASMLTEGSARWRSPQSLESRIGGITSNIHLCSSRPRSQRFQSSVSSSIAMLLVLKFEQQLCFRFREPVEARSDQNTPLSCSQPVVVPPHLPQSRTGPDMPTETADLLPKQRLKTADYMYTSWWESGKYLR